MSLTTAPVPVRRSSLLDTLRGTGIAKPKVDPELAGGLRDWLEDSLAGTVALLPVTSRSIRVDSRAFEVRPALNGNRTGALGHGAGDDAALGTLVRSLFRQWVTTGHLDNPMEEALAGLAICGDPDGTLDLVTSMRGERRRVLTAEVLRQAECIAKVWPPLNASWLPRTQERITIPLCGGRIMLRGVVDLVVGPQAANEATVCVVEVDTAPRRPSDRDRLHFYALLETLRAGAPPSRVATFHTRAGQLDVEPVDEHMLVGALMQTVEIAQQRCSDQIEEVSA